MTKEDRQSKIWGVFWPQTAPHATEQILFEYYECGLNINEMLTCPRKWACPFDVKASLPGSWDNYTQEEVDLRPHITSDLNLDPHISANLNSSQSISGGSRQMVGRLNSYFEMDHNDCNYSIQNTLFYFVCGRVCARVSVHVFVCEHAEPWGKCWISFSITL